MSGADIGVFTLMSAPVFGRREILGKRCPCTSCSSPAHSLLRCTARLLLWTCGHMLSVILYCHEVIIAISHRLPPLGMKEKAAFIWQP